MFKKSVITLLTVASLGGAVGIAQPVNAQASSINTFTRRFHSYVGSDKYQKRIYSPNKAEFQVDNRVKWTHRFGKVVPKKSIKKAVKALKLHQATNGNLIKMAKYLAVNGTPVKNWRQIFKTHGHGEIPFSAKYHFKAYKRTKYGVVGTAYLHGEASFGYNPISGWTHA